MRAKSFTLALFKKDKNKMVIKEPKVRFSKELRQAGFGRKAGAMADKRRKLKEKQLKKELRVF